MGGSAGFLLAACLSLLAAAQDVVPDPPDTPLPKPELDNGRPLIEDYDNLKGTRDADEKEIIIGADYLNNESKPRSGRTKTKNKNSNYEVHEKSLEEEDSLLNKHNDDLRKEGAYKKLTATNGEPAEFNSTQYPDNVNTAAFFRSLLKKKTNDLERLDNLKISDQSVVKKNIKPKERELVIGADFTELNAKLRDKIVHSPRDPRKSSYEVTQGGLEDEDQDVNRHIYGTRMKSYPNVPISNDIPYAINKKEIVNRI